MAGEMLVCAKRGHGLALEAKLAAAGLEIADKDRVSGVLLVRVPAGAEAASIAQWNADADVDYAERNGLGGGGLVPNDTSFGAQWHLQNTGQLGGSPGADIRAVDAWDVSTGSSSIVVAVLDSGIDSDHPEFAGRIDPDGYDFVNEDANPEDDHGHGTGVSGVLCANANNSFAVAGVDWQCGLLPIKVLNSGNGGTVMDLAQGLNYCATQADLQIISMSLINYPGSQTLINALQAARNAGKILIACAGNGGIGNADVSYPGASPLTISIGATTRTDARAGFSGTGLALDFVAPGADVVTARYNTSSNLTSTMSGCSFATPMTAGIVSLAFAQANQIGAQAPDQQQVYDLLRLGAIDQVGPPGEDTVGRDNFFGHGRLDARSVLDAVPSLINCGTGTVGSGAGGPFAVVRVNGLASENGSRTIVIPANGAATLSVDVPPNLPQPGPVPPLFLLWAHTGDVGVGNPIALPLNIGDMCFDPTSAGAFVLFADTAPWSVVTPPLPVGFVTSLQGVILHTQQADIAVTNLVGFDPQPLPPPVISSVVPEAPLTGQNVEIKGAGFLAGLSLEVSGSPVSPLSVTATKIVFAAPGNLPCDTTLTVTNADQQTVSASFNPSPLLNNIVAPSGFPAAGGTLLLLIGTHFVPGTTVTIGGNAMSTSSVSALVINGTLPPGNVGPAAIVITRPDGCTVTGTLTYTP